MTMLNHAPRVWRGLAIFAYVSDAWANFRRLAVSRPGRRPRYRLEDLDDHLLRDIGLTRRDVDDVTGGKVTMSELEALRQGR